MKSELTQKKLKELLRYDQVTGLFTWKVDAGNGVKIGDIAGCLHSRGYMHVRISGVGYKSHRLSWLFVYGYFPENEVDHIDRIRHHNWISNLREASRSCNARNTGNPATNTSGVKGVYWHKSRNKWYAQTKVNGKRKYLGSYKNFHNAVCARLMAEQCLNWEGCDSNSPAYNYVQENICQFR